MTLMKTHVPHSFKKIYSATEVRLSMLSQANSSRFFPLKSSIIEKMKSSKQVIKI